MIYSIFRRFFNFALCYLHLLPSYENFWSMIYISYLKFNILCSVPPYICQPKRPQTSICSCSCAPFKSLSVLWVGLMADKNKEQQMKRLDQFKKRTHRARFLDPSFQSWTWRRGRSVSCVNTFREFLLLGIPVHLMVTQATIWGFSRRQPNISTRYSVEH